MSSADFWVGPDDSPDTYRLVTLLGGGGEGQVWKAILHLSEGGRSTVAVKILRPEHSSSDGQDWKQFGHLLRSLADPGLVRVTDVFTGPWKHRAGEANPESRAHYVVMDYIEGPTLWEWCLDHPQAKASERLRMLRMVASALDQMHSGTTTEVPVAHGDVKPANVVVSREGAPMLVDLGLARLTDAIGTAGRSAPYAAPELRNGALATCEADRYAFAVTAAQVLTGQPPPTDRDGFLDRHALEALLRTNEATATRHALVGQLLRAIDAPPEARPARLLPWIESVTDSLSQTTTGAAVGEQADPAFGPNGTLVNRKDQARLVDSSTPRPRRRRRKVKAVAALAFVLLTAALAGYIYLKQMAEPTTAATPALAQPLPSSTVSAPAEPNESTTTDSRSVTPAGPVYLSDSAPVEDGQGGIWKREAGSVSGQSFGHALKTRAICDEQSQDYWVDYNLARNYSRFTAKVGISDSARASSKASYNVLVDGRTVAGGDLIFGQAVPLDIPVDNVLRLRLQVNEHEDATKTNCYSGNNGPAFVVWGDPMITPKP
jgi:serine/threonine protein kinase